MKLNNVWKIILNFINLCFHVVVVVFPQSQFTERMFPDMPLPLSSNCATAPSPGAVGDLVTPIVME